MKEGLLDSIKAHGYWRINFQPLVATTKLATMQECRDRVESNVVSLRGWSYPHFDRGGAPDSGGVQPCGKYLEGWVYWDRFEEYWRMYQSGQFINYVAMRLDKVLEQNKDPKRIPNAPGTHLPVVETIYFVTEVFEFLARLVRSGLYDEGVRVSISLHGLENRILWVDDPRRMEFFHGYRTGAPTFDRTWELSREEVMQSSREHAHRFLIELFDAFGWNPTATQIANDQEKLLTRSL